MNTRKFVALSFVMAIFLSGAFLLARGSNLQAETAARQHALVGVVAPAGAQIQLGSTAGAESSREVAQPVASIPLRDMPVGVYNYGNDQYRRWLNGEIDLEFDGIPPAQLPALWAEALQLPAAPAGEASAFAPTPLGGFDSLDSNDCCGGGQLTPPDPEMAAGPNHAIAVVNAALEIYDLAGNTLVGPTTLSTFFTPLGGPCQSFPFDPNVLYDEEHDRFFIAADGNGQSYCVGVSQTSDPTGAYWLYDFASVDIGGAFFDYPHAGVGDNAIYMGANLFGSGQGYVYAMDKTAMYSGAPAAIIGRILSGGFHTTPQPTRLHGWLQGTWPSGGPHHFLAGTGFSNASTYQFYSWNDPFGANVLTYVASFNFPAIHGVAVGVPVQSPQMGGISLTANDPRPLDFEYRNGSGWTTMVVSCNPGGGTVNCIQWAEIDLAAGAVAQTDVFRTTGQYRYFPDIAADDCGQAIVGYTRSNSASFPSVYAAGPLVAGSTPGETLVKAGEVAHYTYANRWGDYTGMTVAPDGMSFWYLGEYSKNNAHPTVNWGNWIGHLSLDCQGGTDTVISRKIKAIYNHPNFPGVYMAKVQAVDPATMTPVAGATVDVTLTLPDGATMPSAMTNAGGWAKYMQATAGGGNCTITVDNITAPGYTFDPGQGVTTKTIPCSPELFQLEWSESE